MFRVRIGVEGRVRFEDGVWVRVWLRANIQSRRRNLIEGCHGDNDSSIDCRHQEGSAGVGRGQRASAGSVP